MEKYSETSSSVTWIDANETIGAAERLMANAGTVKLWVTRLGAPIGFVSASDIIARYEMDLTQSNEPDAGVKVIEVARLISGHGAERSLSSVAARGRPAEDNVHLHAYVHTLSAPPAMNRRRPRSSHETALRPAA